MKETNVGFGKLWLLMIPLAAGAAGLAAWGPEALARYQDRGILNQIQEQKTEAGTEGYRYSLGSNEKAYILSRCLDGQSRPESDQNAMARGTHEVLTGTYAFVANRKDASGEAAEGGAGIRLCAQGIRELKRLGVLPGEVREPEEGSCSAVLYSAIDVPDPRNNVLVWKVALNAVRQNADKENRLLDAYVDADTGKVYEFYVRTKISSWEDVDADSIVAAWARYLGLEEPRDYENANPLSENTPYFKKYIFAGMEKDDTVVTVGFYEGIRELYLKISK